MSPHRGFPDDDDEVDLTTPANDDPSTPNIHSSTLTKEEMAFSISAPVEVDVEAEVLKWRRPSKSSGQRAVSKRSERQNSGAFSKTARKTKCWNVVNHTELTNEAALADHYPCNIQSTAASYSSKPSGGSTILARQEKIHMTFSRRNGSTRIGA